MTPPAIFAILPRAKRIAVLPISTVEQHGPLLPLSVDQAILDGIIAAPLPLIPEGCPAILQPTCSIGKSNEHVARPGTLTASAATLMSM